MGQTDLARLVSGAPVNFNEVKNIDLVAVEEALLDAGVDASSAIAVSWCQLGTANIEANIESDALAVVCAAGVVATAGKRKMMGKNVKYRSIDFSSVRSFAPVDHTDERGYGRYGIAFVGAGNVFLGRLQWSWQAKRFRDSRAQIMAVAEERDRILAVVSDVIG